MLPIDGQNGAARRPLAGVVLWGACTTEGAGLSDRDDLPVLSVAGSEDGLSDPAATTDHRAHLPPNTVMVEVGGMNHAQFGAYGDQRGDGRARIGDTEARTALADAVTAFPEQR
ncbi:alpha/beta hydrolase [Nocardiopsis sp. CNT312]|uniref:alpha/beta hydrolase n=1 Tax=Nocardiopsis sp. CNT312 TaxID=1137268 RepID=UPI001E2DBFAD|nr:alpha/beta hydrolase [Nocardiopsis sp. CNT312]